MFILQSALIVAEACATDRLTPVPGIKEAEVSGKSTALILSLQNTERGILDCTSEGLDGLPVTENPSAIKSKDYASVKEFFRND